jgi:hypothetical protein
VLVTPMPGRRGSGIPFRFSPFRERTSGMCSGACHHKNAPACDIYVCVCMYVCVCVYMYVCVCVYIYIYIYIYIIMIVVL